MIALSLNFFCPFFLPLCARLESNQKKGTVSLWDFFQANVKRIPDEAAYVYEGKTWTFKQADLGELLWTLNGVLGGGPRKAHVERSDEKGRGEEGRNWIQR